MAKKIIGFFAMAMMITALLSACGKDDLLSYVSVETVPIETADKGTIAFAAGDDTCYLAAWQSGDGSDVYNLILTILNFSTGERQDVICYTANDCDPVYLSYHEKTDRLLVVVCEPSKAYTVLELTGAGEYVGEVDISDNLGSADFLVDIKMDAEGYVYLWKIANTHHSISVLDSERQPSFELSYTYQIQGLYTAGQSGVIAKCYDQRKTYEFRPVSISDRSWSDALKLTVEDNKYFDGSLGYDLYTIVDSTLYGIDSVGGKQTALYSWIGMEQYGDVQYLYSVDEDTFFIVTTTGAYLVNYAAQEENNSDPVQEKTELVLAGVYFDPETTAAVAAFNLESDDTVITIKKYQVGPDGSLNVAYDSMTMDIITGNAPDMFLFYREIGPMDALISQGVFADLYPLLDIDPMLSRIDFFPAVLETIEQDDSLYYFPISFGLKGIVGAEEYSQSGQFPLDIVKELCHQYPENEMLFGLLNPNELITLELAQNMAEYVNWETRECNFNSARFLALLEAVYYMPTFHPEDRDSFMDFAKGVYFDKGLQLFDTYVIRDLEAYLMMAGKLDNVEVQFNRFGEGMACMSLSDSPAVLEVGNAFAISSTCKDPETAWAFLSTLLRECHQQELSELPVSMQAFSWKIDELIDQGKGEREDFALVQELIASVDKHWSFDAEIYAIVGEEIGAYLAGDKTSQQVVEVIQNRVSTYVAEY